MTATLVDELPEVADALEKLSGLPDGCRTEALEATVVRRAHLLAAARLLDERITHARQRVADCVEAIAGGNMDVVGELAGAHTAARAAEDARASLPAPTLDGQAVREALGVAERALDAADRSVALPRLAYQGDLDWWRTACQRSGQLFEPPVTSMAEQALVVELNALAVDVEACHAGSRAWGSDMRNGRGEPLTLLSAAAGHLSAAEALAARVAAVAERVAAANEARQAGGHGWCDPRGPQFLP